MMCARGFTLTRGPPMTSADPRRRHQRIESPLDILVDGPVVRALDWSLTGFAVPVDALPDRAVGDEFDLEACFHLPSAIIGTHFRATVVRRQSDRVGCRFVDPSHEQLGILRQLHSAYRAGRSPRADAITAGLASATSSTARGLVRRASAASANAEPNGPITRDGPGGGGTRLDRIWPSWTRLRPRAALAYALIGCLGAGLGTYAVSVMIRPVEATFAAVNLPGDMLRAPSDGVIEEVLAQPGDLLSPQSALVRFRPRGAPSRNATGNAAGNAVGNTSGHAARFLPSPCTCSVAGLQVQGGQAVRAGDPLIRLAPLGGGAPAVVESLVAWEHAGLFVPGAAVAVRVSGTDGLHPGRVIEAPNVPASALPRVVTDAARGRLATVYVSIEAGAAPLVNGQPARVRLDRSPLRIAQRLVGG